jgi:hypothetical protein
MKITPQIIELAKSYSACADGIAAASIPDMTWESLPIEYVQWAARHLPLPQAEQEEAYRLCNIICFRDEDGLFHRDDDQPAYRDETHRHYIWYRHGYTHREGDLPASVDISRKMWWVNGRVHRDNDKPAIEYENGGMSWYQRGKLHRDGGLPAVCTWIDKDTLVEEWWENGKCIRTSHLYWPHESHLKGRPCLTPVKP